jgi:hypothetical protein
MWRFHKEKFRQFRLLVIENLCIIAGVTCLFFGITPRGVKPQAPEEAWSLALPLFAVAFVLFVWDKLFKR